LQRCHGLGTLYVGLSDEGLADGRIPRTCPACDERVRAGIERYNAEQDLAAIAGLSCACRADWLANVSPERAESEAATITPLPEDRVKTPVNESSLDFRREPRGE
jgi:uncharacterized Fe-S cluster-containing MiaB family protein